MKNYQVLHVLTFLFFVAVFLYGSKRKPVKTLHISHIGRQENLPTLRGSATLQTIQRHVLSMVRNTTEPELKYAANVHFWDYICGFSVDSLRNHPLFPYSPFRRSTTDTLEFKQRGSFFGVRVFGYLHSKVTGYYKFAITSDDASEFWLSSSYDPMAAILTASIGGVSGKEWAFLNQFDKYPSQMSKYIFLRGGGKYFFELLWKQDKGRGHEQLVWKQPHHKKFEKIDKDFLSKYYDDSFMEDGLVYEDHIKLDHRIRDLPQHESGFKQDQRTKSRKHKSPYRKDSKEYLTLPRLPFEKISDVLSVCNYRPSYLLNTAQASKLKLFGSVHLTHYYNISTRTWPNDGTWQHSDECIGDHLKRLHCEGNQFLDENTAVWLANSFMAAMNRKFARRYQLHTLVNVEQGNDDRKGHRYLLEAALVDKQEKKTFRLSVYLYHPRGKRDICYPKNFQWNSSSVLYLTLTVKNQGPWVLQYVRSMARIYRETNDSKFSLIIVDFDSYDVDIEAILKLSGLPHYKVIKKGGAFHKTIAIQDAARAVKDPNAIILQTDLHTEFPLNFLDETRKHCIQGKMGFTPILLRLACGRLPYRPGGFWEYFGYGIFGLFKSDWDIVGGMNIEKYRNTWGGEDWEFADRVIKHGYEIDRLRIPYFFHYFHTKKGMWDGKAT